MTSRDFCYWLQGYFELTKPQGMSQETAMTIQKHLALVFRHEIDPSIDGGNAELAQELQSIHDGGKLSGKPPVTQPSPVQYRC